MISNRRYISMEDDGYGGDSWNSDLTKSSRESTSTTSGAPAPYRTKPKLYRRQYSDSSRRKSRTSGISSGHSSDSFNQSHPDANRYIEVNDNQPLKYDVDLNNSQKSDYFSDYKKKDERRQDSEIKFNLNTSDLSGDDDRVYSGSDDNYFTDEEDETMERKPLGQTGVHAGKLVTFYRNGDPHYKGLQTSVSRKQFPTFETLLIWLNEKIPTSTGVRHVFALPSGKEIKDVLGFKSGSSYVVSSSRLISRGTNYGQNGEKFWRNNRPSASRIRRTEQDLFISKARAKPHHSYPGSRAGSIRSLPATNALPLAVKPRLLIIISNTNRNSREKVILNPQTTQNFEEMLKDIASMIDIKFQPVHSLYTHQKKPKRINGFSDLIRCPKHVVEFLVCGQEMYPEELQNPGTLANGDGYDPSESQRKKHTKSQNKQNHDHDRDQQVQYYDDDVGDDVYHDDVRSSYNESENDRFSPPHGDTRRSSHEPERRKSYDPPVYAEEKKTTPRAVDIQPKKEKPFRKSLPDIESVKVHIHGSLREFFVPRYGQTEFDPSKPDKKIELDWVYGYRGLDGRNNLFALPSGELLYYVAGVAIIYNKNQDRQRHYQEHTEDITCMALHTTGTSTLVATGQSAGLPNMPTYCAHVRIWDPTTLKTRCVIGTSFFSSAVVAVSFSQNTGDMDEGSLLMAIDDSNKHTLSVWDWKRGRLIGKTATTADAVVWGTFHPHDHTTIVTYGKQHVYFWKLFWDPKKDSSAKILRDKKSGVLSMDDMPRFVTSVCFSAAGDVLSGDSNGCITVWSRDKSEAYVTNNQLSEAMKHAHNKNIFALCMNADGTLISGAGSEVKAWDSTNNYRLIKTRSIPEGSGSVRTLIQQNANHVDGALYIGTTSNSIMEGSMQKKFTTIIQGHSEELWAISAHPDEHTFVTAGYDQYVCKWDIGQHKPVWKTHIEKPGLSVTFDPYGRLVVVGTTTGRFIVLDAFSGSHMASVQVSNEALDGIKFSHDASLLAMGSHDGNVYVYDVLEEGQAYKKHHGGVLKGHSKFVNHLDWSKDGKYLQTVSGEYDLLFWDVKDMQEVSAQKTREVEWFTQDCVLGYNVLGAWSNLREGEDITTVSRNNRADEIAVGDNTGTIRMYRFPCVAERPDCHQHKRYSGRMNKMTFTYNDRFLLTSGGSEAGLMQWAVIEDGDYL